MMTNRRLGLGGCIRWWLSIKLIGWALDLVKPEANVEISRAFSELAKCYYEASAP